MSTTTIYRCDFCRDEIKLDDKDRQLVAFDIERVPTIDKPTLFRVCKDHPIHCARHACRQCLTGMAVFYESLRETGALK